MKSEELLTRFQNEHSELHDISMQIIKVQTKFEATEDAAKCDSCEIGKRDRDKDFFARYQECKKGLRCSKVVKQYTELASLKNEETRIRSNYAKKIFQYLSEIKPDLLNRQDKSVLHWDDVFSADFENLEPKLITALVAMVEMVGGRYRIVES